MSTDVERLVVRMEANMRGYERALQKMQRDTNGAAGRVENRFRRKQRNIDRTFTNIQRNATRALGMIGVAVSGAGLARLVSDSLQAAESLNDLSLQVNANVEGLQSLRFAVDQNGGSADVLDRGLRRLAEGMGRVLAGETNEATRALDRLGLGDRIRSGEIQTTDELFRQLADAMQGLETQAERTAAASQIFGQRMGVQLSQSLSLGTAGMAEFEEQARALGLVMDEEVVSSGARVNAMFRRMRQQLSTQISNEILTRVNRMEALGESINLLSEELRDAIPLMDDFVNAVLALEAARARASSPLRDGVMNAIQPIRAAENLANVWADIARLRRGEEPVGPLRDPSLPPVQRDRPARTPLILDDEEGNTPPPRAAPGTERDSSQPVLIDKLAAAMKEADRQRIEDADNKARELARFQEIAKDFAHTLAEESAREMERAREDFANTFAWTFASGMQAAFDGRLQDFIKARLRDAMFNAMMDAFANIGRRVFDRMIGSAMGGGFPFGGARMSGGGVSPGRAYTVGERGPETFVPGMRGSILPNPQSLQGRSSGGGGTLRIRLEVGEGPEFATRVAEITGPMVSDGMQVAVQTTRAEIGADMANRQMRSLR